MTELLQCVGLFMCAIALEVGWVLAVRSVERNAIAQLVVVSMGMQSISYASTLIVVENNGAMVAGITGAGLGAVIGLKAPASWFRRGGPSS